MRLGSRFDMFRLFLPVLLASFVVSSSLGLVAPLGVAHAAFAEICDNCVDEDADDLVDRADPDCSPLANGGGAGIGDPVRGKAILKCHKAIEKAGLAFSNKRLKGSHGCIDPAFACVQLKNGDPTCLTKAAAKCLAKVPASEADQAKLLALIAKACDPALVSHDDLGADLGIGLEKEEAACAQEGITGPDTIATFANCVLQQHVCRTNRILSQGTPRARELFVLMGFPVDATALPCLLPGSDGGGQGLGALGKPAVKCAKAISKASVKVGAVGAKALQKCLDLGVACLQLKNGDPVCLEKARAKCQKLSDKLQAPTKGAFFKIIAAADKGCAGITQADLNAPAGLGFDAQAGRCTELGVPEFNIGFAITCTGVQQLCDGEQMLIREIPRFFELTDLLNISLPGGL